MFGITKKDLDIFFDIVKDIENWAMDGFNLWATVPDYDEFTSLIPEEETVSMPIIAVPDIKCVGCGSFGEYGESLDSYNRCAECIFKFDEYVRSNPELFVCEDCYGAGCSYCQDPTSPDQTWHYDDEPDYNGEHAVWSDAYTKRLQNRADTKKASIREEIADLEACIIGFPDEFSELLVSYRARLQMLVDTLAEEEQQDTPIKAATHGDRPAAPASASVGLEETIYILEEDLIFANKRIAELERLLQVAENSRDSNHCEAVIESEKKYEAMAVAQRYKECLDRIHKEIGKVV